MPAGLADARLDLQRETPMHHPSWIPPKVLQALPQALRDKISDHYGKLAANTTLPEKTSNRQIAKQCGILLTEPTAYSIMVSQYIAGEIIRHLPANLIEELKKSAPEIAGQWPDNKARITAYLMDLKVATAEISARPSSAAPAATPKRKK